MKTHSLDVVQDELIGKIGAPNRDKFEYGLQVDIKGQAIKRTRQVRKLTQEELGNLIGVQKAQIARIENNVRNVIIETLMRVFNAVQAKVMFSVELPHFKINSGK